MMKKAVVLLSGGLDSATCLAIARSQSFECYCLSFNYGQRHCAELAAADKRVEQELQASRNETSNRLADAERRAHQIIEEAKVQARIEADKVIAGAKAEIEQEAARAKEALRERVAELAVAGAEKILRREIDAKAHADLLARIRQDL